jgi:hypothetical protein
VKRATSEPTYEASMVKLLRLSSPRTRKGKTVNSPANLSSANPFGVELISNVLQRCWHKLRGYAVPDAWGDSRSGAPAPPWPPTRLAATSPRRSDRRPRGSLLKTIRSVVSTYAPSGHFPMCPQEPSSLTTHASHTRPEPYAYEMSIGSVAVLVLLMSLAFLEFRIATLAD